MQCTSYIPVYYHARDLNAGASGFSRHIYNNTANYGEERGYNISLPPKLLDQYLGYDKEVLKQIIQNHEVTFRHQVQELHRLYRTQRELMDEMRVREFFTKHLLSQTSESIRCLSHAQSDISQTSHATSWFFGDRSHSKLSELTADNIQQPTNFVAENFQEQTTVRENSYNEVKFLSSRSKGNGNGILDLELPAHVSHDDERKQLKEGNLSEAPELTCNTHKKLPNVQPASDSEIGSVKTGDSSSFNLSSRKTSCLIDLNEPIQLESLPSSSTGPFETYTSHMEITHNDPCVSAEAILESVVPKHSGFLNSDGINSSMAIDLNSVPISCFSQIEIPLENLRTINKETTVVLEQSSAYDHAMWKENCFEGNPVLDTKTDDKFLKTETYIDLNTRVLIDEPSPSPLSSILQIKSAGDIHLDGPVSPENEEGSPPRGKSEDIQLETPTFLSEQGEQEPSMELDIIAARTLVIISSSGVQEYMNAGIPEEQLVNSRNCLCWFAEIVSSTGDDLENELMKIQNNAADNDQGELLSHGIYDIGTTTVKLSEENALNLSHVIKKEKETGTLSSRSRRCHTRGKRQRKDFQTEVLPSIASLSKDFHTTEGFLGTCSLRKNAGKKACAKPRKYSKTSPLDVVKKSVSKILKQPATRSKQGILQGWGKIKKRRGGCRRRASKFIVIN